MWPATSQQKMAWDQGIPPASTVSRNRSREKRLPRRRPSVSGTSTRTTLACRSSRRSSASRRAPIEPVPPPFSARASPDAQGSYLGCLLGIVGSGMVGCQGKAGSLGREEDVLDLGVELGGV